MMRISLIISLSMLFFVGNFYIHKIKNKLDQFVNVISYKQIDKDDEIDQFHFNKEDEIDHLQFNEKKWIL